MVHAWNFPLIRNEPRVENHIVEQIEHQRLRIDAGARREGGERGGAARVERDLQERDGGRRALGEDGAGLEHLAGGAQAGDDGNLVAAGSHATSPA